MNDLKPCPFCGRRPVRECLSDGKEYIICSNVNCPCKPMTAAYKPKGAAARAWNRRAFDVAPVEDLERLRDDLCAQDLITMEGLRRLNTLIWKYTTAHDGGADHEDD